MTKTSLERAEAQQWADKVQVLENEVERLTLVLTPMANEIERLEAEIERLKGELERANDPTWAKP